MKRTLLFMACMLSSIMMLAQQDSDSYVPFVDGGKSWIVARSTLLLDTFDEVEYCILQGIEEDVNGKAYYKMKAFINNTTELGTYLIREENRKVYQYDPDLKFEFLLFDYSLKEGDTYETYSYEEQKKVTNKVLSVGDYTEGPEVKSYYFDKNADSIAIDQRYLRKWVVKSMDTDISLAPKTWIEGVGSLNGPFANLYVYSNSIDHLAYVFNNNQRNKYLPFSFNWSIGKLWIGCDLPVGAENEDSEDGHHHLTYELEGNHLHVYGRVLTRGAHNNYAYFIEEPTDDPLVRKLHFDIQEVGELATYVSPFYTEFYVPGLAPNFDYIIVDNQGEEHPVINKTPQKDYRPFVEDDKVWKVGAVNSGNPVQWVEYYYFDGDTIIGGKTCKQMMRQRYVNSDFAESNNISQDNSLSYVGAWYEENKKVYEYDLTSKQFQLMYDFSLDTPDTLWIDHLPYFIGMKQTGGMKGFKGVYRDVMMSQDGESFYRSTPWLESVGGVYGPPTINVFNVELGDPAWFLMSCAVGDEVIYFNGDYEEVATPVVIEARKRIDFTHTIKIRPKSRMLREAMQSLYGEYNDQQLGINLAPLDDAYLVRIADETGKAVYEKAINACSIVGLNIDISTYAKGRYTVTVENSLESFTGEFESQTTGIGDALRLNNKEGIGNHHLYDLQGRRLTQKPAKGIYIQDGKKVVVK